MTRSALSNKFGWLGGLFTFAFVLTSLLTTSCADDGGSPPVEPREPGTLSIAVTSATDIAGFQIDVSRSGASAYSQFVPNAPSDGGAARVTILVALPPGSYAVTATPMKAPGAPSPDCMPISANATVTKGRTSEVTLVARCQAGRGAIGVNAGVNYEPELTSLSVEPSTFVSLCEGVSITFDATDRDGDHLTCDIALGAAQPVPIAPIPSGGSNVQCSGRVEPTAAGDQTVTVRACDPKGCASLEIPLHVAGAGACSPTCDDGNPCTVDEHTSGGICSHSRVPDGPLCTGGNLRIKLLGFNDFHGQIEAGRLVAGRPVGGAAVLASYLKAAQAGIEAQTIIVHAGDHLGASPPASALFQDEPAISFLNLLANASCSSIDKLNPACNVVGTLGNHEFDEGKGELLRMLNGGNFPSGPFFEDPYPGARFPYVSANVVDAVSGDPLLRPFVVKKIKGIPVGFIGAVLKATPTIVTPTGVAGLSFLDEADAINAQVPALHALGVRTIVVTIHQGGFQTSYTGPTRPATMLTSGPDIQSIVVRLDDDIDVVVSGHTHAFTNALIPNAHQKNILVVQAFSASTAYDDVDLLVDPATGDVVSKTAQIVTTFGDAGPGLTPDPAVGSMVSAAVTRAAPLVSQVFGNASVPFSRAQNAAGESALGDLIADAQLASMGTQFAFMNPGGIRADLDAGPITFGELFTIQPFGNTMVKLDMTGAQIVQVLEQQWIGPSIRMLQIAGFDYTWDPARPIGSRIVEVRLGGVPISPTTTYAVTCNNFLATGGDSFPAFTGGTNQVGGPVDLDALIEYVEAHTPIGLPPGNRIRKP